MARDKTPNRTLKLDLLRACDMPDCYSQAIVSRTVEGKIQRRCMEHRFSSRPSNAYLLKFLGLTK